ncbi:MAG TPA: CoA transferase [Mycobacteriales bacterium]|jgi:formyl-CoA transferase|nr:CoA transferase [Mycobacteriales bacterium]
MSGPFDGVKVIEVAAWTFVPGAGAIMADLGADVIKVEPPTGDPQRGLMNMLNQSGSGPNPFLEVPNRGKRSITVNLASAGGRSVLLKLVKDADVFITSYLPDLRSRLGIEVEDLRVANPGLIYLRGSGWGSEGPMINVGGYDAAAAWASSGTLYKLTAPDAEEPVPQPAAFFDLQGSSAIAGAVAMALFKRERTGEPSVVDVSLLNTGMWTMGPDIAASPFVGEIPRPSRKAPGSPLVNYYLTSDRRWIVLVCLQADRFWAELCEVIGRPELADDPKYIDASVRFANREECVVELDQTFAQKSLLEWKEILSTFSGVWAPAQNFDEVHSHVQVEANHYLSELVASDGTRFKVVAPPYQFDGAPSTAGRAAPELGQHTEELMLEAGMDWEAISAHRESGDLGSTL